MKTIVCFLLVASCALAVPVDPQTTSTSSPAINNYGARVQPKPAISGTQQHPAQLSKQAVHDVTSVNDQTKKESLQSNEKTAADAKVDDQLKISGQQPSKYALKRDTTSAGSRPISATVTKSVTTKTPASTRVSTKAARTPLTPVANNNQPTQVKTAVGQNNDQKSNTATPAKPTVSV
ncbi:uncharacterized protein LOC129770967 [Toxorhynchites rutilus septentrionalis]|uniref:uncharacterized protein LOC129770967 n=1 Tax=Toxorhynchites rutilus septentrionalis TaxID=329112 RepID=UPI00247B0AE3|nr:uncharacterized protein LOC129770967 [Toxorhynchites rutilus septentrionalis]